MDRFLSQSGPVASPELIGSGYLTRRAAAVLLGVGFVNYLRIGSLGVPRIKAVRGPGEIATDYALPATATTASAKACGAS
jgi:hypothetical protein